MRRTLKEVRPELWQQLANMTDKEKKEMEVEIWGHEFVPDENGNCAICAEGSREEGERE